MLSKWIRPISLFILLVLLQVWVFNQVHLFGVATPLLYIYFVLKLPSNMNRNLILFLAFLIGLSVDVFSYSLGMHALAATVAGFSRYYSLKLFSPRDMPDEYTPSTKTLSDLAFLRYAGLIVLLHQIVYFAVEMLSLFDPLTLLLRIVSSFILTMILILAFESITFDFLKK